MSFVSVPSRAAAALVEKIEGKTDEAMKLGSEGIQVIGETVAVDYINVVFAIRDVARHLENIASRAKFMV